MPYVILNRLLTLKKFSHELWYACQGISNTFKLVICIDTVRSSNIIYFRFLIFPTFSLLFRFVLKIFYGTIVIENVDLIPETGRPWSVDIQTITSIALAYYDLVASSVQTIAIP